MENNVETILASLGGIISEEEQRLLQRQVEEWSQPSKSSQADKYGVIKEVVASLLAKKKISVSLHDRLQLALQVASLSNNNEALIKAADNQANVSDLRDLAVYFDTAAIEAVISPARHEGDGAGGSDEHDHASRDDSGTKDSQIQSVASISERPALLSSASAEVGVGSSSVTSDAAKAIRTAIFRAAPTATVQGMLMSDKIKVESDDPQVKADLINVLSKLGLTDLGTVPVPSLLTTAPEAFSDVPEERRAAVTSGLKTLSRVTSIAPSTKSMEALVNGGYTTSLSVASVPKDDFVATVSSPEVPAEAASAVHANAVNSVIRNENMLVGILQLVRGTGLQVIDGKESTAFQQMKVKELKVASSNTLDFESLFGSMDQCVCDDCTTVYSPASYFVDLLQYLRASRTVATPEEPTRAGEQPSIKGTVLEKLLKRRPDLAHIQLTCENTNTALPYIDLANEVMESFITHLSTFTPSPAPSSDTDLRNLQTTIDVHNVEDDEDSSDLLAEPQHTDYTAYQALAAASYPHTLPYHQPVDAQRAYLDILNISRLELLDAFRPKPAVLAPNVQAAVNPERLVELHRAVLARQLDAEVLGLAQEEYVILTGQSFFESDYFAATEGVTLTPEQYASRINLLPRHSYWGYPDHIALSSTDDVARTGLQFVKRQLLPRSGITFSDLVSMVETRFVNPSQPSGRNKHILNQLRFSYKFLCTLVDNKATDPTSRLSKLATFAVQTTNLMNLAEQLIDQSQDIGSSVGVSDGTGVSNDEIQSWIFNEFEGLGKTIVLDSGEGPRLPIEGPLIAQPVNDQPLFTVGYLSTDGLIRDEASTIVGNVAIDGRVFIGSAADEVTIEAKYDPVEAERKYNFIVKDPGDTSKVVGIVVQGHLKQCITGDEWAPIEWYLPAGLGGSCSIENVRLTRLDGTSLAADEWDNLHKFIRLQRALGWSVQETDMALQGLLHLPTDADGDKGDDDGGIPVSSPKITVDTLHQLAAIKKLVPLTGLTVEQLLTFWTSIPTGGSKSLYSRLFLNGNILRRSDAVFGPDNNGDYLLGKEKSKISQYLLVILAAFGMKAADLEYLLNLDTDQDQDDNGEVAQTSAETEGGQETGSGSTSRIAVPDVLNIANLSRIYRYSLLAKLLGVSIQDDLGQVLAVGLPNPFRSPTDCLELLETWGAMGKMGFSWPELRFIAEDDTELSELDPLAPQPKKVLQTAKTIHDGILAIEEDHTIPGDKDDVSLELVQSKAALIFDEAVVTEIAQLLEGKTAYLTRAPKITGIDSFQKKLSQASSKKATYIAGQNGQSSQLLVIGILTKDELTNVASLLDPEMLKKEDEKDAASGAAVEEETPKSVNKTEQLEAQEAAAKLYKAWQDTVARASQQPRNIFLKCLVGVFPSDVAERELKGDTPTILAPDISEEAAAADPDAAAVAQAKTPSQKRRYFLQHFIGLLRTRLSQVLVRDTITSTAGFGDRAVAQLMLEHIALDRTKSSVTAMQFILEQMTKEDGDHDSSGDGGGWNGYLSPTTSDMFTFSVSVDEQPPPLVIDGKLVEFSLQQEDPYRLWATPTSKPLKLDSNQLYNLQMFGGVNPQNLQWKPATGARTAVPSSAFLPSRAQSELRDVFVRLQRAAITVNRYGLSTEEVDYIYDHPDDFEGIDLMHLSVSQWKRLKLYVDFRNSLPSRTEISLVQLYGWAVANPGASRADLVAKIHSATGWSKTQVAQILNGLLLPTATTPDLATASDFTNGVNLSCFALLISISSKTGVEIPRLFSWATPRSTSREDFSKLNAIAQEVKKAARARYSPRAWPDVVKPASDALRANQNQALIDFLLARDEIRALDIRDADGLFEFFLIDPQMTSLVETSRIKQATATVQAYVQRCLLGLEEGYGVSPSHLDRRRWEWMQRYRVWEANRKVFLYPENWLDPSLRDDKSDFFRELESELLQKDLSRDTVASAIRGYLYSVHEVANLSVAGLCIDYTNPARTLHLFARTRTAPFAIYYNTWSESGCWGSWKKMAVEMPVYTIENNDKSSGASSPGASGVYLAPIAFDNRVVVFIPQILKKTVAATASSEADKTVKFGQLSDREVNKSMPVDGWDVKLSWTELRNGAWTPRRLCPDGVVDLPSSSNSSDSIQIDSYTFLPTAVIFGRITTWEESPQMIKVFAWRAGYDGILAEWNFTNGELSLAGAVTGGLSISHGAPRDLSFGYSWENGENRIHSTQSFLSPGSTTYDGETPPDPPLNTILNVDLARKPYAGELLPDIMGRVSALSPRATDPELIYRLSYPNMNSLMSASLGRSSSSNSTGSSSSPSSGGSNSDSSAAALFSRLGAFQGANEMRTMFGAVDAALNPEGGRWYWFNELSQPFSLYNWELGLHAPMSLVDRLLKSQQFEEAIEVCHYVFNPMAKGERSDDMGRFWNFAPFKFVKAAQTVEAFFQSFRPGDRDDVTAWRNNPFAPHVVARSRPTAYMKWIVMKYIEILIEWGDWYFRQNTLEAIPNAIQLYILASHLYGPRGQKLTREVKVKPQTYTSLLKRFDAFSNALVQMEELFPFSNQTSLPLGKLPDDPEVQVTNIFGFAAGLYFAIPDNPQLRALGERIDDRLFKIRHSQDITGVPRKLPLFEPPIDPALLVQAASQGLSLADVLADLNGGPMPNYRFQYLLGRALELAQEVRSFGQALLQARERQDAESYAVLRATHETSTQRLLMTTKKLALDEANAGLEALRFSRKGPENRMRFYLRLAGEDISAVPSAVASSSAAVAEFSELSERLQSPVDEGGLKLLPYEVEENAQLSYAANLTVAQGVLELLSGVFHALPVTAAHGTPVGVGIAMKWGPPMLGHATSAAAKGIGIEVGQRNFKASAASRKAVALRSLNDRLQAANAAGYEISNIDKQIVTGKIRVAMAQREIDLLQTQIDQAREAEDFLRAKYSNAELYGWIAGQTRSMYYNAYTAAYDLAKKVEKVFRFERPQLSTVGGAASSSSSSGSSSSFIQPGYWSASRDGLLAGEALFYALKQLEAAYIADRGHDYEVVKHVSLRQIDPLQLLILREAGSCEFAVPEVLFDMDFPGHYLRRIKTVGVTVPCVVGPYASVNATLKLLSNRCRTSASLGGSADGYPDQGSDGQDDPRFATVMVPISAVAVSSGQAADSGVFELSFLGDRYMPFEGAGAVSAWRLELPPPPMRAFDYNSISDVVLTIKYTSLEGGAALRDAATKEVERFVGASTTGADSGGGLYALFDVKNEFATGWARLLQQGSIGEEGVEIVLAGLRGRLPLLATGRAAGSVEARDVYLLSDVPLPGGDVEVELSGVANATPTTLAREDGRFKGLTGYVATDFGMAVESWTLRIGKGGSGGGGGGGKLADVKRLWMLVRYVLK